MDEAVELGPVPYAWSVFSAPDRAAPSLWQGKMISRRTAPSNGTSVVEVSAAEAAPGAELPWVSDDPAGPAHHAVEVGLVLDGPDHDHVRVVSHDDAELDFAVDRVVVAVRGVKGPLARSRASDGRHAHPAPLK